MAAYRRAIEDGADFIECDVTLTKDLHMICSHDPDLNATTDAWVKFRGMVSQRIVDGELREVGGSSAAVAGTCTHICRT